MNEDKSVPISAYKNFICGMIQDINNADFLRKIYSIIAREWKRS